MTTVVFASRYVRKDGTIEPLSQSDYSLFLQEGESGRILLDVCRNFDKVYEWNRALEVQKRESITISSCCYRAYP